MKNEFEFFNYLKTRGSEEQFDVILNLQKPFPKNIGFSYEEVADVVKNNTDWFEGRWYKNLRSNDSYIEYDKVLSVKVNSYADVVVTTKRLSFTSDLKHVEMLNSMVSVVDIKTLFEDYGPAKKLNVLQKEELFNSVVDLFYEITDEDQSNEYSHGERIYKDAL